MTADMSEAAQTKAAQTSRANLDSNLASPRPDTLAFLNDALARLREIPFQIEPARRVECLLSIAQQFYHQGQSVFSGVEPAALAVMLAADLGDAALASQVADVSGNYPFADEQSWRRFALAGGSTASG